MESRAQIDGVWRRESIAISGGEAYEDSVVYWLQAGDYFADMRWPLAHSEDEKALVSAFAGTVQWSPPRIRFLHEIDLTKAYLEDAACLSFVDGNIVERGQVTVGDEIIDFEEICRP